MKFPEIKPPVEIGQVSPLVKGIGAQMQEFWNKIPTILPIQKSKLVRIRFDEQIDEKRFIVTIL